MKQKPRGKPFAKGNQGRVAGTPNKLTATVKDTVLSVFNQLQEDPKHNLLKFATKYPREFYNIASRLIPAEMTAKVSSDTVIRFVRDGDSNTP